MQNEHASNVPANGENTEEEVLRLTTRVQELEEEKKGLEAREKELTAKITEFLSQIAWFRKQMFGKKSEKMDTRHNLFRASVFAISPTGPSLFVKNVPAKRKQTLPLLLPRHSVYLNRGTSAPDYSRTSR